LEQTLLYTTETLYHRNKVKTFSIYLVVLLAVTAAIALLPVLKVDISTQARGVVRSVSENVPIVAVVSGRVVFINLSNNQNIQKGDTLLFGLLAYTKEEFIKGWIVVNADEETKRIKI
jgi:HlyD family secretion protein